MCPAFSCHYRNSVCFSPLAEILTTPLHLWSWNIYVSLSLIAAWWVDRPHNFKVNVFKRLKNMCVTLRNVTTEHLFSAIKHTFFGVISHLVLICVPLFRTVLANHVLISIFELGSKVSEIVTTETFGEVSVVTFKKKKKLGGVIQLSHRTVTTETVTTETCHRCFGNDKREHIILIFGILVQLCIYIYFNFVCLFFFVFCILVCFSVLVCKLKFCNVMWSLQKHYCH